MKMTCMNCVQRLVVTEPEKGREVNCCGLDPEMRVNGSMYCEEWEGVEGGMKNEK